MHNSKPFVFVVVVCIRGIGLSCSEGVLENMAMFYWCWAVSLHVSSGASSGLDHAKVGY